MAVTLVEVDVAGGFARVERGTTGGMLTLHPEPEGRTAHGNVVRAGGVEPVTIDWWAEATIAFDDDGFGSAVAGWSGSGWTVAADLSIRRDAPRVAPLDRDERGVPTLDDASEWALEV